MLSEVFPLLEQNPEILVLLRLSVQNHVSPNVQKTPLFYINVPDILGNTCYLLYGGELNASLTCHSAFS